jgi:hypothetical protein
MSCYDVTDDALHAAHTAADRLNAAIGPLASILTPPSGPWLAPPLGAALGFIREANAYAVLAHASYMQAVVCFASNGTPHAGVQSAAAAMTDALGKISTADGLVASSLGLCFVFVPVAPQLAAAITELASARDKIASIPQFVELQPANVQPAVTEKASVSPVRQSIDDHMAEARSLLKQLTVPKPYPAAPWSVVDGKPVRPA